MPVAVNTALAGDSDTAAADCNAPDWPMSHYIVPVKNPLPLPCGLSSNVFDHLLVLTSYVRN